MNYSKFRVEDFVLDQNFRKWVLYPTPQSNLYWENWLVNHPNKVQEVAHARKIILNTIWEKHSFLAGEKEELWGAIEESTRKNDGDAEREIWPISGQSVVEKLQRKGGSNYRKDYQWVSVAAILLVAVVLGFMAAFYLPAEENAQQVSYTEKITEMGTKARFTLSDGTKVVLNAGSKIRYLPHFTEENREVFLEGEAYFDVYKDSSRPFIVHSGNISTKALGTAFNVRAFEGRNVEVALVEGLVEVEEHKGAPQKVWLQPGNMLSYDVANEQMDLEKFDTLSTVGWIDGILVLRKASQQEVIDKLEHWYGVEINTELSKNKEWAYSGEFKNQSLESVLTAIAYSMKFDFEIHHDTVKIF